MFQQSSNMAQLCFFHARLPNGAMLLGRHGSVASGPLQGWQILHQRNAQANSHKRSILRAYGRTWFYQTNHASLTTSIFWVWNANLGKFIYQEGKRTCETAHGDTFNVEIAESSTTCTLRRNSTKQPNFHNLAAKEAKFPNLVPCAGF